MGRTQRTRGNRPACDTAGRPVRGEFARSCSIMAPHAGSGRRYRSTDQLRERLFDTSWIACDLCHGICFIRLIRGRNGFVLDEQSSVPAGRPKHCEEREIRGCRFRTRSGVGEETEHAAFDAGSVGREKERNLGYTRLGEPRELWVTCDGVWSRRVHPGRTSRGHQGPGLGV